MGVSLQVFRCFLGWGAALAAAACVPSEVMKPQFWQAPEAAGEPATDGGLAALVRGDLATAEHLFGQALASNPNDAHALVGAALVAEKRGDARRARQLYAVVADLSPPPLGMFLVPGQSNPGAISDLAEFKLAALAAPTVASDSVTGTMVSPAHGELTADDRNILTRFEILDQLLAELLITPQEHAIRRRANLGALLPLTHGAASAGLTRPVPAIDDVVGRMRAIGQATAMGALDPVQHARERDLIVEALLPAQVRLAAPVPRSPQTLSEAAVAIKRLDTIQNAKVINASEYAAERQAIDASLQRVAVNRSSTTDRMAPPASAMSRKPPAKHGSEPLATDVPSSPLVGSPKPRHAEPTRDRRAEGPHKVHLASYRAPEQARRGWAQLVRTYGDLLGALRPDVSEVDLGPEKGRYYRLTAGPLETDRAAAGLCAKLKAKHQYCQAEKL